MLNFAFCSSKKSSPTSRCGITPEAICIDLSCSGDRAQARSRKEERKSARQMVWLLRGQDIKGSYRKVNCLIKNLFFYLSRISYVPFSYGSIPQFIKQLAASRRGWFARRASRPMKLLVLVSLSLRSGSFSAPMCLKKRGGRVASPPTSRAQVTTRKESLLSP